MSTTGRSAHSLDRGPSSATVRCVAIVFVLVAALPVSARTWSVGKSGDEDFASISAAISSARAGDIVDVRTGTWRELVELKSGVSLVGAGAGHTVLEYDRGSAVVVGKSVRNARLTGFTLRHDIGSSPCFSPVINCEDCDEIVIASNTILGSGYIGVLVKNSGLVSIESNRIADNSDLGIWAIGVRNLRVVANEIVDNGFTGIMIVASHALLEDNRLADNPQRAVLVGRAHATPSRVVLNRNEIRGSRLPVVEVGNQGDNQVELKENLCPGSTGGLYVFPYPTSDLETDSDAPRDDVSIDYINVRLADSQLLRVVSCSIDGASGKDGAQSSSPAGF